MRPFHQNSMAGRSGGSGPMSEHLRDLDLELELLKRKREMIEKQQSLLNQQQAFNRQNYNYDQPQSYRNQQYDDGPQFSSISRGFSGSSRDFSVSAFSNLYDEPQPSRDRFPKQSAKKRLGDYVWPESPAKRQSFNPSSIGILTKYVPHSERSGFVSKNKASKPRPSQRFKDEPQKPRPNDFKPNKVTKPYKTANANVPHATNAPKKDVGDTILYPDRVPTQQMAGRLELALGNILKSVKDKYGKIPEYAHCFTESALRQVKQSIRERIREVMLGKPVGGIQQIMKEYRIKYPVETDEDFVQISIKKDFSVSKARNTKFTLASATAIVNPFAYFKRNYTRLLSVTLNKMFNKLEAIAREESEKILEAQSKEDNTKTSAETANAKNVTEEIKEESKVDKPEETQDSNENAENCNENSGSTNKNAASSNEITVSSNEIAENSSENADTTYENDEIVNENTEALIKEAENTIDDTKTPTVEEKPRKTKNTENQYEFDKSSEEFLRQKFDTMMDELMPKKLAFWMPKMKSQILKVLSQDIEFEKMKQTIINETNQITSVSSVPEEPVSDVGVVEENKKNKLDYHVKIQGRPSLPKKSLMTEFLKKFNPKLIKKIKNVRNLLYVGFDNKEDFDRIVAANGTIIGTDKIIVKISTWVSSKKENTDTPNTSTLSDHDVTMKDLDNSGLVKDIDSTSVNNGNTMKEDNDNTIKEHNENTIKEDAENTMKDSDENQVELNDVLEHQIDELLSSVRNEDRSFEESNEAVADEEKGDANVQAANIVLTEDKPQERNLSEVKQESNEGEKGHVVTENTEGDEEKDKVGELKNEVKENPKTPVRASSRLANAPATPSSIRTRRASRLAQN